MCCFRLKLLYVYEIGIRLNFNKWLHNSMHASAVCTDLRYQFCASLPIHTHQFVYLSLLGKRYVKFQPVFAFLPNYKETWTNVRLLISTYTTYCTAWCYWCEQVWSIFTRWQLRDQYDQYCALTWRIRMETSSMLRIAASTWGISSPSTYLLYLDPTMELQVSDSVSYHNTHNGIITGLDFLICLQLHCQPCDNFVI